MTEYIVWIDRKRTFKLTPEAMARESELTRRDLGAMNGIAAACWLFLIHEEPGLTVDDVKGILVAWLEGDTPLGLRHWQMRRLRTRLGRMLNEYLSARRTQNGN